VSSVDRWEDAGALIDFRVSLWTGGGIGDCAHHYKDLAYFRILRHLKQVFPNLSVVLQLVGTSPGLTKQLFELDPYIDEIVTADEKGFMTKDVYEFMANVCSINKIEYGRFCPQEISPETAFQRAVNRVYATMRFPRMRTVTMDDFFQQMKLEVNDFEWDLAEVFLSEEEVAFGESVKASLKPREIVGIHWYSKDVSRACVGGGTWLQIAQSLLDRGYGLVIFGAPNEKDMKGQGLVYHKHTGSLVSAWQKLRGREDVVGLFDEPLRKKIAALKECKYLVSIEGAMMHLAWLHAIPTLAIVEQPGSDSGYLTDPHGYHWAAAAGEPFAKMIVCDRGAADRVNPKTVLDSLCTLDGTKGKRESKIWRDQFGYGS